MPRRDSNMLSCFLALPFSSSEKASVLIATLREGARGANYKLLSLDDATVIPGSSIQEAVIATLARSDCIIADVSDRNPNIYFELGLAQAMGKGVVLISEEQSVQNVPADIQGFRIITYSCTPKGMHDLARMVQRSLVDFRESPRQTSLVSQLQISLPFFIDWEILSRSESENLCLELLSQLGFRKLDWGKRLKEVDLVAEYPRKDPDGFEFRELWFVSMGMRVPIGLLLDMISEPDYLLHRMTRYSERMEDLLSRSLDTSITLLLIPLGRDHDQEEFERLQEHFERRRMKREPFSSNIRLRIWDQNYLTSLIHRFPHLGFKYFSDEGRIRSKTRKSYEELYSENATLSTRLGKTVASLEDEKNRRVRAERDSVWKDISFTAAHRIGNPIFAIETDLDPLTKRIMEDRKDEANAVVSNIQSSVEKAKAFVEQFKSLAKAQEIRPIPCDLKPILEDSCKALSNHEEIECSIECPDDLKILGDPERLGECFDELIMNATHWLGDENKRIQIVVNPSPDPIPDFLDSSQQYILTHVRDNGCGVEVSIKTKIFDAFFTKYDHGTGLGLALVRRIIDGHEGGIIETGTAKNGADFEVYLPMPPKVKNKKSKARSSRRKSKEK